MNRMSDFYRFLEENHIDYERHDHPPVYTVEEAGRLVPTLAAAKTKNLFLRDKKGQRHFLVVVPAAGCSISGVNGLQFSGVGCDNE